MIFRPTLTGVEPVVEYRVPVDRYFITYPSLRLELAMPFEHKLVARELALAVFHGLPFFTALPCVVYGTEYPRPEYLYPEVRDLHIPLVIVKD